MKDKKSMIMVIFIGITIFLFFCFNTTVFATTGTVITNELRLRKESSTTSEILGLLDENQVVEILGEDGDWYKVKVNSDVGYVSKEYVKVKDAGNVTTENTTSNENDTKENNGEEENSSKEENKAEVVSAKEQKATIKDDSTIRIIPLINGDVINTAKSSQEFKLVSNLGVWSYIENNEMSGWVLTQNLSIEDVADSTETTVEETSNEDENDENESQADEDTDQNEETQESSDSMYESSKTYYVSGTSVNVRSGASKTTEVIDALTLNDEVSVTGENGEWYVVSINGKKGYIAKTLLSTTKKEVTSRSTNPVQETTVTTTEEQYTEPQEPEYSEPSAPSGTTGSDIAAYAQQFVGYPYVYGASGPNAFDCSGFAQYVYKQFGYYINRTADNQAYNGYYVSKDELQPGDLVFFNTSGNGIGHVGIYIGGDQFVHASTSRTGVIISSLSQSYYVQRYVTARRIV